MIDQTWRDWHGVSVPLPNIADDAVVSRIDQVRVQSKPRMMIAAQVGRAAGSGVGYLNSIFDNDLVVIAKTDEEASAFGMERAASGGYQCVPRLCAECDIRKFAKLIG